MRLSSRDGNIVAQLALHADSTMPELARRSGEKVHTVRYVLTELTRRGLLAKRWVVDLMACGWSRYEIFFSMSTATHKTRQAMVTWLCQLDMTTYLAEVGGEFDYELILLAKDAQQVKDLLADMAERFGESSFSKVVALHQRVHYFPRKYLAKRPIKAESLSLLGAKSAVVINELDHKILRALSEAPDLSQRELALRCSCAILTVQSHLQKLRERGVVRGAMFSLRTADFAAQNYIFLIYAKGFQRSFGEKLFRFSVAHAHCTNMKECFGSWDFEVGVEVSSYTELQEIKEELLETFVKEIERITLLSRFAVRKFDFYPFRKFQGQGQSD